MKADERPVMARAAVDFETLGVRRRRFTADEYERMAKAGILRKADHVELIDGDIVRMCAVGSEHAWFLGSLNRWFLPKLVERADVRLQNPVRLTDNWEPEPDVVIARLAPDGYFSAHPKAGDILLVIEVADSSLGYDRGTKLPMYARSGIPEVWILAVARLRFEVYREPVDGRYRQRQYVERGGSITPVAFPDLTVPVDEILPPPAPAS
jgi:Uma2 family endonuclease